MVSNQLIVFCCVAGAGISVFLGWAFTHRFVAVDRSRDIEGGNEFSQVQYMREVRLRNQDTIAAVYGFGRDAYSQS